MDKDILIKTVAELVKIPKGILAIDESLNTCNKRFEKLNVPTTEKKRREYRELLITAPEIEKYISGYILFDETIRQSTLGGKSFVSILKNKGINIGIKVDQGFADLSSNFTEKITQGLDGLSDRLQGYKKMGATFAKWRAVYNINKDTPSQGAMTLNAKDFVEYAFVCQENNIVPFVEPEVLFDGNHSIEKCYEVTATNFIILFKELKAKGIFMPGIILKTSMVLAGKDAPTPSSPEEIAEMTLKCLKEHVPADIGGIVFLSGGQDDQDATLNLNTMHKRGSIPWPLTFSFNRAIQNSTLESWAKNPQDIVGAQKLLLQNAEANSKASVGEYIK